MIPMLDLTRQYASLRDEIDTAIRGVVESGHFIDGPNVAAFETELADYTGARHAVALNSGTDALHLSLHALNVTSGDEVITTPFTFIATAEAITFCGATPVFVDVDPVTLNIDATAIEAAITPRTRAIIPVHLYGLPADLETITRIATKHHLAIVEDCAQALGARIGGRRVAAIGTVGAISFFPSKNLGAYGDGGAIVTDDTHLAERIRRLRTHGSAKKYHHLEVGLNSRLDEIQAAILRVKLPHLDGWIEQRRRIAAEYRKELRAIDGVRLPVDAPNHTYHQFTIRVPERDRVTADLKRRGVQSSVHYPAPVHLQPAYESQRTGSYPNAESAAKEVLSLPIFPEIEPAEIAAVALGVAAAHRRLHETITTHDDLLAAPAR
jgi:dTDP-4-amino-4,6-dideoxygalactose transaminase